MEKYIILGDLHLGAKKFSLAFFENQMVFFEQQLIPYMLENKINKIIQTGDLLDNRTGMDINFLYTLRARFFKLLKDNNIHMITYLGNHDLYYKNTRDVNLIELFQELYTNNITVLTEQTVMHINGRDVGFIPFIVDGETIPVEFLNSIEYVFGHLEISGIQIARGVVDNHSELTSEYFHNFKNIKTVFSGHYHINDNTGFIKYVGIPYNMTWGDYGNKCGFHILNEDFSVNFIENNKSLKYVKVIYDSTIDVDGTIITIDKLQQFIDNNSNIEVKMYLYNLSETDNSYSVIEDIFKVNNITYSITDNREYNNPIINVEDVSEKLKVHNIGNIQSTDNFLHDYIKENHADLYDLFLELMKVSYE